jgi:hypothetical protein
MRVLSKTPRKNNSTPLSFEELAQVRASLPNAGAAKPATEIMARLLATIEDLQSKGDAMSAAWNEGSIEDQRQAVVAWNARYPNGAIPASRDGRAKRA